MIRILALAQRFGDEIARDLVTFVPGIVQRHRDAIDRVVAVESDEAIEEMRRLASRHGLFVGPMDLALSHGELITFGALVAYAVDSLPGTISPTTEAWTSR